MSQKGLLFRGRPVQRVRAAGRFNSSIKLGWWRRILSPDERAAYARLRLAAQSDQRLGQVAMLDALGGGHHRKLRPLFETLEAYGFIECSRWGKVIPMDVIVNEVPEPPDDPRLSARLESDAMRREGSKGETRDLVLWFVDEWERRNKRGNKKTRYPLNFGRDYNVAGRLLARHEPAILRRYMIHWFMRMDRPHTLTSFAGRINEIILDYNKAKAEHDAVRRFPPMERAHRE